MICVVDLLEVMGWSGIGLVQSPWPCCCRMLTFLSVSVHGLHGQMILLKLLVGLEPISTTCIESGEQRNHRSRMHIPMCMRHVPLGMRYIGSIPVRKPRTGLDSTAWRCELPARTAAWIRA